MVKDDVSSPTSSEDRPTFGRLVVEHQSRIRNYISSLGVASSTIDDIAQEAFVVAYNSFDSFKPGTSFPAWVNTIARNLVWNDRRKVSRRFKLLHEKATDELIQQDPASEIAEKEDSDIKREALRECMGKLPDKSRNLLVARYETDMKPSQIAKSLGMAAGTLRKQLMRIRQILGKCISDRLQAGSP